MAQIKTNSHRTKARLGNGGAKRRGVPIIEQRSAEIPPELQPMTHSLAKPVQVRPTREQRAHIVRFAAESKVRVADMYRTAIDFYIQARLRAEACTASPSVK